MAAIAAGAPLDPIWGSQAVVDLYNSEPWNFGVVGRATLTLQENRYPLVVYPVASGGTTSLRSVQWRSGVRQDEPMFPVDNATSGIRTAAHGDRVAVLWSEENIGGAGGATVKFSLRTGGVWSLPETIMYGHYPSSDLAFTPDGTPVVAIASRKDYDSVVRWFTRGQDGWADTQISKFSRSISSCNLVIDPNGVPTVAWRAYDSYSGGGPDTIQYARREEPGWVIRDVSDAAFIEALFSGAAGDPCVITRRSNESAAEFRSLGVAADPPVTITTQAGPVECATAMPDGTICAVRGGSLIVRKDGKWSEAPCPLSHGMAAGADGTLHLVGEMNRMISYGTLLPGELPTLYPLSTYAQGSANLYDVAMHPDGSPRIFGWLGYDRMYSKSGTSWRSKAMVSQNGFRLHAYDRAGRLHAFSPESAQYAVEQPDGSMAVTNLPVFIDSSSSRSVYAFMLDQNDVPHAGFYTGIGTPKVMVRYAVKSPTGWTVEKVAVGEPSAQHCALAVDPGGQPWMFTTRGLLRRGASGWSWEYRTSGAAFPGLGISSDGTVHAVFRDRVGWRSLTGKNGSYEVQSFDSCRMSNTVPGFAMAGDRPLLVYGQELNDTQRSAIILAEKVGGTWRQRWLTPRTWNGRVGEKLDLVATPDGHWTIGGSLWKAKGSESRGVLFVCPGQLARLDPKSQPILQSVEPGGGSRFQFDMGMGPSLAPLELQSSDSLAKWTSVLDLGPDFRIRQAQESITMRGDPFRTRIVYESPAGKPAWFVRLAGAASGN